MQQAHTKAASIPLSAITTSQVTQVLPFIAQPICKASNFEIFGYELLFRGESRTSWFDVDSAALTYLATHKVQYHLFVNLSDETILHTDDTLLFAAAANNSIFFEWNEKLADNAQFRHVVDAINRFSQRGLRFVIDDFGAGRDGFERLFAADNIAMIKFDGEFFRHAANNIFARKMVAHIVKECGEKNILTVGECVESDDDFRLAQSLGLDLVQGFFIDRLYESTLGRDYPKAAIF